ncbi:MAG: response regulator, partial [Campylobacterota bacterium]|nr:response regulator [Campylobacterota bacterium]
MNYSQIDTTILKDLTFLYVEDELLTRDIISEILMEFCHDIKVASNGEEALNIFKREKIDVIITDIEMPKSDGIDLIENIRQIDLNTPIVVISAYSTTSYLLSSIHLDVSEYIIKPISYTKIENSLLKVASSLKPNMIHQISRELSYDKVNGFLVELDKKTALQKKEKLLMDLLIGNSGNTVDYETIEQVLWSDFNEIMSSTALRTVVKKLRQKTEVKFISNVSGLGYRIIT